MISKFRKEVENEKGQTWTKGSLKGEVMFVLVKTIIFMIVCLFVSVFVFGMLRCPDDSMSPSFQGGDLVLLTDLTESIEHQTSLS